MADVPVLVLRAAGINCDEETVHCWRLAGASPTLMHINAVARNPSILDEFRVVTIPGGFSYGDDIAAGKILAQRMLHDFADSLRALVDRGGGILGICNGFQVLVRMRLLPGGKLGRDCVTVTYNDSARFEARWVRMEVCTERCPFLRWRSADVRPPDRKAIAPSSTLDMPVEHAEGKVVVASGKVLSDLEANGQIALRYVDENGAHDTYPANPNGSDGGIAGLCDPTGRIFGLMPHPDRNFASTHHPQWTRKAFVGGNRRVTETPDGLQVFRNAVDYWGTIHG